MPGRVFFIIILLFISGSVVAQEYHDLIRLDSNINSESEESMPLLLYGGIQIYFTRTLHDQNVGGTTSGQDIWVAHQTNSNEWTRANNNMKWNNRENNSLIGVSRDGGTFYLLNGYSGGKNKEGISFSRFTKDGWTTPQKIKINGFKESGLVGYYMSPDFDVLLISMAAKDGFGNEDLYISFNEDGEWTKPRNLGPTINTSGYEISPFLSDDKSTLYFATDGRSGYGSADIYKSERQYGTWDIWSSPENLGPVVNSEKFDAYYAHYDSIALFCSNRDGRLSDIYRVKVGRDAEVIARDSINKIISEAEMLLEELGSESAYSTSLDFSPESIEMNSSVTMELQNFLNSFVGVDARFKVVVESNNLDLNMLRYKGIREYMINEDVNPENIVVEINAFPTGKDDTLVIRASL